VVYLLPRRCASDPGFIARAKHLLSAAPLSSTADTASTSTVSTATAAVTATTAATTADTATASGTTTTTAGGDGKNHSVWSVATYDHSAGVSHEFDFCDRVIRQAVVIQVWQREGVSK
jgi:hypothetical protein